jgi:hypothetical protein
MTTPTDSSKKKIVGNVATEHASDIIESGQENRKKSSQYKIPSGYKSMEKSHSAPGTLTCNCRIYTHEIKRSA